MRLFQKSCCEPQASRNRRDENLMLYLTVIIAVIMMFVGASTGRSALGTAMPPQSESVYICDSPGAKSYHHYRDCKLLGSCKAKVETVKEMSARGKGRDRCDSCNKRLKEGKKKS